MLLSTRQQHVHQHSHWIFVTASVLLAVTLWSTTIGGASAAPGVFDPIVVSLPNDADSSSESSTQTSAATSTGSDSSSSVTVENPSLVQQNQPKPQTKPKYKLLPAYILALNDPDIDGPVDYMPSNTGETLKVIAWDLLPPHMAASLGLPAGSSQDTNTEQAAIQSGEHGTNAHSGEEHRRRTTTTQAPAFTTRNPGAYNQYDNGRYRPKPTPSTAAAITTTPSPRRRPSPTTTTTRATTTTTTTTTRRTTTTTEPTTTVRYDAPQVTTTTPTPFVPDENTEDYFRLENGDSYTLPTWLADFNDTDLDVAVAWEIPKDLSEYNVTVEPDILAPYEPFTDLNVLQVTPSPEEATARPTTTTTTTRRTTTTTTTTRRPTTTTTRFTTTRAPTRATTNWNQRRTTTRPTTTTATPSNAFTAQQPSSLSPNIFFSATNQPNQFTTTYTTTIQPKTTTKQFYSQTTLKPYQTTPITVDIPTSQEADDEQAKPIITNNRQSGAYQPQAFAKRPQATTTTTTSTTTTTTTTTPAPIVVEEEFMNPFDSSTIPPWLAEFDYADVGPGVPFVLNDTSSSTGKLKLEQHAANDANDVHNDLRPPNVEQMQIIGKQNPAPVSGLQPQQKLPSTITTPPTTTTSSSFAITNTKPQNNRNNNNYNNNNYNNNNSNQKNSKYNGIADSFSSTTTTAFLPTTLPPAIASNANLPSKIPIPLPSLNDNQEQVTQPPIVFKPPPPAALDGSSSLGVGGGISESAAVLSLDNTDNQQQTNFAQAPTGQQGQPLPADRERFPPNSNYGNVGQQGVAGQQPAAAAASGFGQRENAQNQGSVTRPAGAAPSNPFLPRQPPFVQPSTPTSFTPVPTDTDNLITSSTINNNQNLPFANSVGATVNNGLAKPNPFGVTPVNNRVGVSGPPQGQQPKKYNWPDFGGPPGVLVPFDNVKSR